MEDDLEVPMESRISKTLSERTTKIVIILVLVMLFFQSIFQVDTFMQTPAATDQGVKNLVELYNYQGNWTQFQKTVN